MTKILEVYLDDIRTICRRYGVRRLELFGSAATESFDPNRSDYDFLVDLGGGSSDLFGRYFDVKEALEAVLGRRVDLVMVGALKNPYFIDAVNRTRQLINAAEDDQAA